MTLGISRSDPQDVSPSEGQLGLKRCGNLDDVAVLGDASETSTFTLPRKVEQPSAEEDHNFFPKIEILLWMRSACEYLPKRCD